MCFRLVVTNMWLFFCGHDALSLALVLFFFLFFSLIECCGSSLLMCSLNVPWHLLLHSCLKELRIDYWLQAKKKKKKLWGSFFQGTGKYSDPITHTYNSHFLIQWILTSCVPPICCAFTLPFILLHLHLATMVLTTASFWNSLKELLWMFLVFMFT